VGPQGIKILNSGKEFDVQISINDFKEIFRKNILAFGNENTSKISKIKVAVVGVGGLGSGIVYQMARIGFEDVILTKKLKNEISAASFEAAAISAAIDMENNAIKIYSDRASLATDKNEKDLFNWLANWEKTHHEILIHIDNELKESVWYDNQFWPF